MTVTISTSLRGKVMLINKMIKRKMFRIFFFLQNLLVDNRAQRDDSIAPSRPRIDCTNKKADFFS